MNTSTLIDHAIRNAWLRPSDREFLTHCHEEHYRASGPGGQRRNKVETAVRLHHQPTGLIAHSADSRSQEENRRRAVRRLRERIAFEIRAPFDLTSPDVPPEFERQRGSEGTLAVNTKNTAFPIIAATALDALAAASGSYAAAASALELSTSQLLKFLKSHRELWRAINP